MKFSKIFRYLRWTGGGAVWLAGAWTIWLQQNRLVKIVTDYRQLPDALIHPAAIVLPGLIVLAAGLLLAGFFVQFILRLTIGGIFVVAGAMKVWEPALFAKDLANFRILPDNLVNLVAITVPWIEVLAGGLLIIGGFKKPSALLITAMLVIFLGFIGQAVYRHLNINCGCFGTLEANKVGWTALAKDGVLLLVAAWLTWRIEEDIL